MNLCSRKGRYRQVKFLQFAVCFVIRKCSTFGSCETQFSDFIKDVLHQKENKVVMHYQQIFNLISQFLFCFWYTFIESFS
jgi:hypothetical protein